MLAFERTFILLAAAGALAALWSMAGILAH